MFSVSHWWRASQPTHSDLPDPAASLSSHKLFLPLLTVPPSRLQLAVRGVLAGNIFDLGASASADLFDQQGAGASFVKTRDGLLQRPWAVDDMDRFVEQVSQVGKCAASVLLPVSLAKC